MHRVLDLGVADLATGADGAERPDEAVRDLGARPDDGRAAHMAAHQAGAGLDHDPAVELAVGVDLAVDAPLDPLEQQAVGLEQRRELPGVDPPPAQDLGQDRVAGVDQPLDGVGDLELAPPRRLDGAHRLVDLVVEEVHADQGEVRGRHRRLLDQPEDPAGAVQLRHPELLRVVHVGQQDLGGGQEQLVVPELWGRRPGPVGLEPGHEVAEVLLQEVVAEVHDEVVVAQELAGDKHGMGQPERRLLLQVGDLQVPRGAISDGRFDLGGGVADHYPDLLDPGRGDGLEAVEKDGLVGHRHQLLGPGVGDRPEPRPRSSG